MLSEPSKRQRIIGATPILFDPERFEDVIAPWAVRPSESLGRLLSHDGDERTPHQRDRDRIIHASAFRRLKHKTQVFIAHEGDHYRTRLTHSLEVAQIARSIARALRLNEDLAEAIALAHDLGHPPFGHAGEDVLNERMAAFGGFDHNVQSLRVVTELERRYLDHDGLNLTRETLEGLAKHGGPTDAPHPVVSALALPGAMNAAHRGSLEAQAAAIADDIAYNTHDIDDGLRAGLFGFEDLSAIEPMMPLLAGLPTDDPRSVLELMRRQITAMVRDAVATAVERLEALQPRDADDVRRASKDMIAFSDTMVAYDREVRAFLWSTVYKSDAVSAAMENARDVLAELFDTYLADPSRMGAEWYAMCEGASEAKVARTVADYVAGMTDTFALQAHAAL